MRASVEVRSWRPVLNVQAVSEDRLDAMNHLQADVDGQSLHAVVAPATRPGAVPLLLTHGWPGSFLEYALVLPLLTDAFTVVVPSLPGSASAGPPMEADSRRAQSRACGIG